MYRTHTCGELNIAHVGKEVTLCGWLQRSRDLGGMTFIDLRDRYGITQLAFNMETNAELCEKARRLGREFVIQAKGVVIERSSKNNKIPTGEIEIEVKELNILNEAKTPPFTIEDNSDGGDDLRMKYRYLDIRRNPVRRNLELRHRMAMLVRNYLSNLGFLEIETPMLIKSTPEGARDFVVPSRMNPGEFYALPQSPQQYKQLLMVAGMDRYFQIVRCFRDEDLRADRQPEFTQIDIEMSFGDEETVFGVVEKLMKEIIKGTKGVEIETPFIRIPWAECMERYGSDKPDLRFGNEIADLTSLFAETEFPVFKAVVEAGGEIGAIKFENAADKYSRKALDKLQDFVKHGFKAKALAYLKMSGDTMSGSIFKGLSEAEQNAVKEKLDMKDNDLVLVIADKVNVVRAALGALRVRLAHELNLIPAGENYKFLWVTDFPMFEFVEEENRWVATHHPFTAPNAEDVDKMFTDPGHVSSRAYDLVLNGYELLSGSIRIHDQELQAKVFEAIGLTMEQAQAKFGFFLDAFKYGTPPHGGVGIGLERLTMVLADTDNIRDVVAFPTTNSSLDLMSDAPNVVDPAQLEVLGIAIKG